MGCFSPVIDMQTPHQIKYTLYLIEADRGPRFRRGALGQMYKRILLASDGAPESLVALREGALMAEALGAAVFLLIVEGESAGALFANAVHPGFHRDAQPLLDLLALGLDRLKQLGVEARGEVCIGEPVLLIAETARTFGADLVIVGHRRQSILERWWSGRPAPIWSTRSHAAFSWRDRVTRPKRSRAALAPKPRIARRGRRSDERIATRSPLCRPASVRAAWRDPPWPPSPRLAGARALGSSHSGSQAARPG